MLWAFSIPRKINLRYYSHQFYYQYLQLIQRCTLRVHHYNQTHSISLLLFLYLVVLLRRSRRYFFLNNSGSRRGRVGGRTRRWWSTVLLLLYLLLLLRFFRNWDSSNFAFFLVLCIIKANWNNKFKLKKKKKKERKRKKRIKNEGGRLLFSISEKNHKIGTL